ncbi:MAG: hypothetical protein WCD07_10060 [Burkholderiales bacterium]
MKTSAKSPIYFVLLIVTSLSAGLAFAGQNCPPRLKSQSVHILPAPALEEQLKVESDDADAKKFLQAKKHGVLNAEQFAAANLKCYAALHRDLDGLTAEDGCEAMPNYTAQARQHKIFR